MNLVVGRRLFTGLLLLVLPISAISAEGILLGPATRFEAGAEVSYFDTDNFYYASDNEVDAGGFLLEPELSLVYAPTNGQYVLRYAGEVGQFDTVDEDDYFDHKLGLYASVRPLSRHAFDGELSYDKGHDPFGTVRTSGQNRVDDRDMDEWDATTIKGGYTFGAESAKLNWFLRGSLYDINYTTNEIDPINPALGTRFLDRERNSIGTGITYKLGPKTKMKVDLEHTEIDYDLDLAIPLDGTLDRAMVGFIWLATSKTSGEFWIGRFEREFDDSRRDGRSGASWDGKLNWSPRTFITVTLETGQMVQDAILLNESFIDRQYFGGRLDYWWSTRFYTFGEYKFLTDEYVGTNREDDIDEYFIGAGYELSARYSVTLALNGTERDSNINFFDYSRNNLLLSINAEF